MRTTGTTDETEPLVLTVPGLDGSGPDHWQTIWEATRENCRRVELGQWSRPHRTSWINQLNLAIRSIDRPVFLAAHSLGCIAVAWWAVFEAVDAGRLIAGALLVAPPEIDFFPLDERVTPLASTPRGRLPFPSILAASGNDPWAGMTMSMRLAQDWGSSFVDVGKAGHINADSGLGGWPEGQALLDRLIDQRSPRASVRGRRGLSRTGQYVHAGVGDVRA